MFQVIVILYVGNKGVFKRILELPFKPSIGLELIGIGVDAEIEHVSWDNENQNFEVTIRSDTNPIYPDEWENLNSKKKKDTK